MVSDAEANDSHSSEIMIVCRMISYTITIVDRNNQKIRRENAQPILCYYSHISQLCQRIYGKWEFSRADYVSVVACMTCNIHKNGQHRYNKADCQQTTIQKKIATNIRQAEPYIHSIFKRNHYRRLLTNATWFRIVYTCDFYYGWFF